jgi:hypothetical protein
MGRAVLSISSLSDNHLQQIYRSHAENPTHREVARIGLYPSGFVPDSYCRAGRKSTNALIATSERNAARTKTIAGCAAHIAPAISDAGR